MNYKTREKIKQRLSKHKIIFFIIKKIILIINYPSKIIWYAGRKIFKNSIFCRESEMGMCSACPKKTIDEIVRYYKPSSVLDIGCGTGKSLDYFLSKNINTLGIEGSSLAIKKSVNPNLIFKYNLNKTLDLHRKFDLIWCFEVIEHIHPTFVNNLMQTFSNHSNIVIMSAARPGQGGEGHFNEQDDKYWCDKFKQFGYILDTNMTNKFRDIPELYSENMYIFVK